MSRAGLVLKMALMAAVMSSYVAGAQEPAQPPATAAARPSSVGKLSSLWPHHGKRVPAPVLSQCECVACVASQSTKSSTHAEYRAQDVTKCYVKAQCDLFNHLTHEEPKSPEAVAVRRRVLMKRVVTEEKPVTKYEPSKVVVPCLIHRRFECPACGAR
jgi:hypothetical protein